MDGAYWSEGTNPEYNIVCPKCIKEVRVYNPNLNCYTNDWLNTKYGKIEVARESLWKLTHSLRKSFKTETAKYN